jgi:hypothetical protein
LHHFRAIFDHRPTGQTARRQNSQNPRPHQEIVILRLRISAWGGLKPPFCTSKYILNTVRFKTLVDKKEWEKTSPKSDHPMAWRCAPRPDVPKTDLGTHWTLFCGLALTARSR